MRKVKRRSIRECAPFKNQESLDNKVSRALIAAVVVVVILLFFFGKLTTDDRCTAAETTLDCSIARAKHVTEVNDITCNYDRLISGRGALTRSSETEVTLEPPVV